jgi:pimeloyl-ACP methyl ester carboxylesterase
LPHVDLVTYDRRGYQGSRGLTPLGLTPAIDDLLALITAEAPQPVLLFGHSYGGTIATGAAARQPDAVAGVLVYEAPLPWVLSRTVGGDVSDDGPSEAEGFFRRMVGNSAWERLSESDKVSRRADGDGLVADLRSIRGNPPAPYRVEDVAAPYVYAYGDQHAAAYFEELAEELHRRNPLMSGRLLAGAPHGAHLAAPDHIATLITELETTCALA